MKKLTPAQKGSLTVRARKLALELCEAFYNGLDTKNADDCQGCGLEYAIEAHDYRKMQQILKFHAPDRKVDAR